MFNKINVDRVKPILDRLQRTGYRLQPKNETPLATLVAACMPAMRIAEGTDLTTALVENTTPLSVPTIALEGMESTVTEVDRCEELLSIAAESVGRIVSNQISTVRNYCIPTVGEIYATIRDAVEGQRPTFWGLDIVRIHGIHNSTVFAQMIEPWAKVAPKEVRLPGYFPDATEEELINKIQTGHSGTDALLADLIANHSVSWVLGIYKRYFQQTGTFIGTADFSVLDDCIVVFLLAKAFDDNPPSTAQVSIIQYNESMSGIMQQAAIKLHSTYDAWRVSQRIGSVVLAWPRSIYHANSGDEFIRVHGEVYDAFIQRGGTPELIIGSQVSSRESKIERLLQLREGFQLQYDRYVKQTTTQFNEQLGERMATMLSKQLAEKIETLPDAHRDPRFSKEQLQQVAGEAMRLVPTELFVEEPYITVRRVVCAVLYSHVQATDVLTRIDALKSQDSSLSTLDAAALVVESLVIEYYRSQFDVIQTLRDV